MALVVPQQHRPGDDDGALTLPSRSSGTIDTNDPQHPRSSSSSSSSEFHGTFGRERVLGNSYNGSHVSDNGQAHFGNIYNVTNSVRETTEEQRFQIFMESLAFERMGFRRLAIEGASVQTCQWVFEEEHFLRWLDPVNEAWHHHLLWIKGHPGTGKSTLMKHILEHLERRTPKCAIIYLFFNARGGLLERSTEGCYRSMLHQMLKLFPKLRATTIILKPPPKGHSWPIPVVQGIFRDVVLALQQEHLVVMVDALDECEQEEVRDMISFLGSLTRSAKSQDMVLTTCFASRHYPGITARFCEEMVLEQQTAHTIDIREYLKERLNVEPESQRDALAQKVLQKSQGIFLWVVLVVRLLNGRFDQCAATEELLVTLSTVPASLDALIHSIISAGASDSCLLPTLVWTLVGNIWEVDDGRFCFAIQFSAQDITSPHRDQCLTDEDAIERFIIKSSKGLVEIIDNRPQFIHESIRDHILKGGLKDLHPSLGCDVEAASHAMVAEWCQNYARSDFTKQLDFAIDDSSGMIDWEPLTEADVHRVKLDFPLLSYLNYWTFDHLEAAYSGSKLELRDLGGFPLKQWINIMGCIRDSQGALPTQRARVNPSASLLYVALEFNDVPPSLGVPNIPTDLLKIHPLNLSVRKDDVNALGLLDENLSMIMFGFCLDNFCGGEYGTPLVAAVSKGFGDCAQSLLDCGANVNVCSSGRDCRCQETVSGEARPTRSHASELSWKNEKTEFVDPECHSPLTMAIDRGRFEDDVTTLVKILIERGANPNFPDTRDDSALGLAIRAGFTEVVGLLLADGADVNLEDSRGCNIALREAVSKDESKPWIEALFRHGAHAKPAALHVYLRTAAERRQMESIDILVHRGANVHSTDPKSQPILHWLVEDSEPRNHRLRKMSEAAWSNQCVSTARALLTHGVDINARDGEYERVLIAASARGKIELVRFFLEYGADIHHRSDKYGTALVAAFFEGHHEIVRMLSGAARPSELALEPRTADGTKKHTS